MTDTAANTPLVRVLPDSGGSRAKKRDFKQAQWSQSCTFGANIAGRKFHNLSTFGWKEKT
jgi:hypothetical protein